MHKRCFRHLIASWKSGKVAPITLSQNGRRCAVSKGILRLLAMDMITSALISLEAGYDHDLDTQTGRGLDKVAAPDNGYLHVSSCFNAVQGISLNAEGGQSFEQASVAIAL
jgi:hypothetical protein